MIKHGANLCQIFPALAVNIRGRPLIIGNQLFNVDV